jgi:hypothetical protein
MSKLRMLDHFVHSHITTPGTNPEQFNQNYQRLKKVARSCRRFVFGPEASARLGEVVRDIPDMLYDNQQFAMAPFDLCSVEVDLDCFIEAQGLQEADLGTDKYLTFIIDHDRVNVLAATERSAGMLCPFEYFLHQEMDFETQLRLADEMHTSRLGLAAFLWGSTLNHAIDQGRAHELKGAHSFDTVPGVVDKAEIYGGYAPRAQGELRVLIAALLLLNRPSIAKFSEVPGGRTFCRGKSRQYLAHTNVSLSVDAVPQLRTVHHTGERGSVRRHEVRGHWRHSHEYHAWTDAGCIHEWEHTPRPTNDRHYTCAVCDSHRWWTTAFTRGDATKGFVVHDGYDVGPPAPADDGDGLHP